MQTQEEKLEVITTCIEESEMCYMEGIPVVPLNLTGYTLYYMQGGIHNTCEYSSFSFDYFEDQE